jgi:glycosyltransferase involved in cell wall biosynthesis
MNNIAIEMERLRDINSGLGQYCLQLGTALAVPPLPYANHLACYLPAQLTGLLGPSFGYQASKVWHKWTGVPTDAALWHCTHQDSVYFPANTKTPVVMTIHDLSFLDRSDYSEQRKKLKIKRLQKKVDRCKGLVYISEFVKNTVQTHLEVPEKMSTRVIHNGANMPGIMGEKKSDLRQPFLFSIGMHPKKNYAVALPILLINPQYQWLIAGRNHKGYQRELQKNADDMGVGDRLVFMGEVSESEKWDAYENCAALLFPSLSEGFGLPVLEAMACGKPVFLSDRGSLPEIGGVEAFYFTSFAPEHIQKVFSDGMLKYEIDTQKKQRMKDYAAKFTWNNAAKEYLTFYMEIIRHIN